MEFGCIGERLPHSFSREIHARIGDYAYALCELRPEEVAPFLKAHDFCGVNVTIPYKQTVIPYLDVVDSLADEVGAVNTVVNRNGRLFGYNTDVIGMERLAAFAGISLCGKKVLILGTGGTSRTAFAVAKRAGAKEILKVSRMAKEDAVSYEEAYEKHENADVIINTTPCGMYPQPFAAPIDISRFSSLSGVLDAVYNPLKTQLVLAAQGVGIPAAGGLYMLVSQAVAAYEYFFDVTAPSDLAEQIFHDLYTEKQNIVLIGMPGSGKSTVGKLLAGKTGRAFTDTDALVEKEAGVSIAELFRTRGERFFRDLETEVIKREAANTCRVIATGGGAVLRKENINALRMNGRIYFLDRPPELLIPTDDRPLGNTREAIFERYRERYAIYRSAADSIIPAIGEPAAIADETERRHKHEALGD